MGLIVKGGNNENYWRNTVIMQFFFSVTIVSPGLPSCGYFKYCIISLSLPFLYFSTSPLLPAPTPSTVHSYLL